MSRCAPLVLVALLAAASLVPVASAAPVSIGDLVTSFLYAPPAGFTGDLTLRFAFDWGVDNPCSVFFGMSGAASEAALWGLVDSDQGETYAFYPDRFVRLHDAQGEVVPGLVEEDPFWSFGIFRSEARSGEEAFLVAGAALTAWVSKAGGEFQNLYFQVQCEQPFRVTGLSGGDTLHAFSETGGEGVGAGGSVPGAEAHVAYKDGIEAAVDAPQGALLVHFEDASGMTAGEFTLRTPTLSAAGIFLGGITERHLGGPGTYGASLTGVSAGMATEVFAAILGLTPVPSTDGLGEWTG